MPARPGSEETAGGRTGALHPVRIGRRAVVAGLAAAGGLGLTGARQAGAAEPSGADLYGGAAEGQGAFRRFGRSGDEWAGEVPAQGAIFCEFVAPDFAAMRRFEGLVNIRLAGGPPGRFQGVAAVLRRETGRIGFGARALAGRPAYEEGPSFHPGRLHRLLLSYDLGTGAASLMLDGGSVFSVAPPEAWRGGAADRVLLWRQSFIGEGGGRGRPGKRDGAQAGGARPAPLLAGQAAAGGEAEAAPDAFPGGARRIRLFDAAELP